MICFTTSRVMRSCSSSISTSLTNSAKLDPADPEDLSGQVMINGFATGPLDEFSLDLFAMLMSTNLGIPPVATHQSLGEQPSIAGGQPTCSRHTGEATRHGRSSDSAVAQRATACDISRAECQRRNNRPPGF